MQTSASQEPLMLLREIRSNVGAIDTPGLKDAEILSFLDVDDSLSSAISEAYARFQSMANEFPELYLDADEATLITELPVSYTHLTLPTKA